MTLSTCFAALIAILLAPTLALIYSISIYCMYVISLDLEWYAKQAVVPLLLRIAVWIAALASCLAICEKRDESIAAYSLPKYLPVGVVFFVTSIWLVVQNRKWEIVGGPPPSYPSDCMKDKVVLVTGANTGIGKEITLQLYQLGATVVMACRNMDKAQQARQEILQQSVVATTSSTSRCNHHHHHYHNGGNDEDESRLRIVCLDLTNLASVREAVKQIDEWKLPMHVIINNAGIMMATRELSVDGYELVMQANHLGHFLLTKSLLPKLLQSTKEATSSSSSITTDSQARVINLTSSTYKICKRIHLNDLFCEHRPYALFNQYAQSKLANILFTQELARRYSTSGETDTSSSSRPPQPQTSQLLTWAVHPGVVKTEVTRNMHWYFRLGNWLLGSYIAALSKLPSQGAWGAVMCAASRDPPPNATYLRNGCVQATTAATRYEEDAKKLWEMSERLVGLTHADERLNGVAKN